jgi:hypothetical protein
LAPASGSTDATAPGSTDADAVASTHHLDGDAGGTRGPSGLAADLPMSAGRARWYIAQADPAMWPTYLASALRVVRRRRRGPRRFPGDAEAICRAVVEACWAGDHLCASAGHFRQAWTRDLGFSAPSLVGLGHRDRLHASLAWMLDTWARRGRVTTTILGARQARDIWTFGVDSLPLLLHALRAADAGDLVARHRPWLSREVERYARLVVDPRTGLVRDDRAFSTHRDTVRTRSNAYANAMVVLLDRHIRETGWFHPPVSGGVGDRFVAAFWRGDRMVDRPDGDEVTGDATVIPFFLGVVPDELGLLPALRAAADAGLTRPLPLRYAARRQRPAEDPITRLFVPDYQGRAIWTSLGAMYLRLLQRADPDAARPVVDAYRRLVERDGTVREVYDGRDSDLRPYRGPLGIFVADEAMLWAAILAEAFGADRGSGSRAAPRPPRQLTQEAPEGAPGGADQAAASGRRAAS